MEVHHHSHTPRKKWTHYFWEFLMLFLAVFAGFMAENQREHFIEHQREKVLMKSMLNDLQADTTRFKSIYRGIEKMIGHIDSLVPYLSGSRDLNEHAELIYGHNLWVNLYYKLIYTDRTIQQLKNSGNFRLIRKSDVSDAIIEYDAFVRNNVIQMQDTYIWSEAEKLDKVRVQIFKSSVFRNWMRAGYRNNIVQLPDPPYFLSTERSIVEMYVNQLGNYAVANEWFLRNLGGVIRRAEMLDSLIREKYRL